MKKLLLLIFVVNISAAPVSIQIAKKVANEYLSQRGYEGYQPTGVEYHSRADKSIFYIIQYEPTGFVIVSADDRVKPILAYSIENAYDENNVPIQLGSWLDNYKDQIEYVINTDPDQSTAVRVKWNDLLTTNQNTRSREVVVEPMISAMFDQGSPWNAMCPTGSSGTALVGCVAISMAQIMHYWSYPASGIGYESYYDYPYGTLSQDLGTPYDWDNMPNSSPTEDTQLLLFECGMTVHMDYDVEGSGAQVGVGSNSARYALYNNFGYNLSSYRSASNYTESSWKELIKQYLDLGQPIIHDGFDSDGGHAWNVDGYDDDDNFHMNWGWGGSSNGWFTVDNLVAGGWSMNDDRSILVNISPQNLQVPNLEFVDYEIEELGGDMDGVVNPGELSNYYVTVENIFPWPAAEDVIMLLLSNSNEISVIQDYSSTSTIDASGNFTNTSTPFTIQVNEDSDIISHPLSLYITADGGFEKTFQIDFPVSLSQSGFPTTNDVEFKSTPVVIDFDDDGTQDIIIGDYDGFVRRFSADGIEITDDTFPFDTGNQIWGSPAAGDIDNDGHMDVAVTSKSKSLYIFDHTGLKTEYDANSYLMGTPAIGQLDGDDDLEIVFAGHSSSNAKLYAINHDGSDVTGFPVNIGEKMFKGVALSDVNSNGIDDIAVGTDSDNIILILDDGSISWSYSTGDKVQGASSIINTGMQTVVCAGSKDDNLYCIDALSGELAFMVETGGNVYTSPSAVDTGDDVAIFFGSDDGFLYAVDSQGNDLPGWPVETAGPIVGSIAYADLDDDGTPEIISTNGAGQMLAFHLDGSEVTYFPITASFPYSGSPHIADIDGDGDLEISAGTTGNLIATDFKSTGSSDGYWRTYRGSQARTGAYPVTGSIVTGCVTADVNEDDIVNVLDIVQTVNFAMGWIIPTDAQMCAADVNGDGIINVLDIVQMVNIVLGG